MKKLVGMTIHDREPEVIDAVFASLTFPGNQPNTIAVCYDRAPLKSIEAVRKNCKSQGLELREAFFDDGSKGFRCPSASWNKVFDLVEEKTGLFISSDCVLGPHSVHKAFHMAETFDDWIIVGKAEHCGPSYCSHITLPSQPRPIRFSSRTMSSAHFFNPLGFAWILPMETVRQIGGYDLVYMDGYCFEDDDFTIRMWNAGAQIMFCDDILALHIEHKRGYIKDDDLVEKNRQVFMDRYSRMDYLAEVVGKGSQCWVNEHDGPGLSAWLREPDDNTVNHILLTEKLYGNDAPWRAIRLNEIRSNQ